MHIEYTGRENDGLGLYFNRARYYSPTLQRFISEDPLGFGGGGPNLYAYAGSNPVSFTDPFGMDKKAPTNNQCFAKAAGSAVFHGAIDAAALVPGLGTAAAVISIGDTIAEGDATDVELTAAGSVLALAARPANALLIASYSARAAEAIPVLGTAFAIGQLGYDGFAAFQKYQACMAGGN